nr:transposase [uncultured Criibacterium sp.]
MLNYGITADYVLMDTWFTNEPMIKQVSNFGLEVIGMVKQLKQRYMYNGKLYTLPQLQKLVRFSKVSDILGSLRVTTKDGMPVKIVFVKNRNKKSECLYILSTDMTLSDDEIVRIYGNRWSIECFFKAIKSLMKLETEFQVRDYMSIFAHTTIVFTRYIIVEYIRRNENDLKSQGEIFYVCCEDIQDMDFITALRSLMVLFAEIATELPKKITEMIKSQLSNWIASQSSYINNLFGNLCWES